MCLTSISPSYLRIDDVGYQLKSKPPAIWMIANRVSQVSFQSEAADSAKSQRFGNYLILYVQMYLDQWPGELLNRETQDGSHWTIAFINRSPPDQKLAK